MLYNYGKAELHRQFLLRRIRVLSLKRPLNNKTTTKDKDNNKKFITK